MTTRRQSPEKLLRRVQDEERKVKYGKLKIYLGAAPGVGKTHEMLLDAMEENAKGLDVVVGIAESHGRLEIESMLHDLEILPRQVIKYHDKEMLEFDLDAALRRHPGLILIDEMAHSNAPGLRHTKRWQDIKELLDRGIDVYTTLNVQHIESLSDDAGQIIHAPIKETVPDSIVEMADTIELVDIPPEELLKRLHEGKVYIPAQAELAVEHFFRKGNLIALRELALRTAAERVGAQVLLYRQGEGIKHVWPTKDKILVCVGPNLESLKLIRAAKRISTSLQAEWLAVYIDLPRLQSQPEKRNHAIQNLRLAEQLGADTRVISGSDIAKEVLNLAREQNVTQIMIWKHIPARLRNLIFKDLADEIVRHSGEIDVYIMTGTRGEMRSETKKEEVESYKNKSNWLAYAKAFGIVTIITLLNFLLFPILAGSNLIMIYLLGVTLVALLGQMGPAFFASILSVLAYKFFFIPPFYSLVFTEVEYIFTLLAMLLVAQVISHLTILTRRQAEKAKIIEQQTSALYKLSRQLASTRGAHKLIDMGIRYIAKIFNSEVLALLPENSHFIIYSSDKSKPKLDAKEESIAKWVYDLGEPAGFGTDTLSFSKALYIPLLGSKGTIGVIRILRTQEKNLFTPDEMRLLEACANQIGLAIEVDTLQEQSKQIELQNEFNRVRHRLLQSVSHDLRTPLVAVIGSASTLMEMADKLERNKIKNLGKEIYLEAEQLGRLINNLLQISYLESGQIRLEKEIYSLKDLITLVVKNSSKKLKGREVNISISPNLPLLAFDPTLIQEVLLNLIDNAVKFTPANSPIDIFVNTKIDSAVVSIADKGPGIFTDEVNKLFEKYYRGRGLTTERGLGLGLAICRLIIEAHDGKTWAENREDGGAIFYFSLPIKSSVHDKNHIKHSKLAGEIG